MKKQILILMLLPLSIMFFSCNSNKKSKEVASYTYAEDAAVIATKNKKIGEWVQEGTVCYGLVVFSGNDHKVLYGSPVKAKVVKISEAGIQLKSLESIAYNLKNKSCTKTGLKRGEIWVEKEGDLFKTKEEAINFLKEKKWYLN
jgi:hypothetical protein